MNNNEKINLRVTLKSIMFKSSRITDVSNFNIRVIENLFGSMKVSRL